MSLRPVRMMLVTVLAGCATASPADQAARLRATDQAAGALRAVLADDVYYLAPELPAIEGRDAVARELEETDSAAARHPLVAEVSADGRHGYTAGRITGAAGDSVRHGKYLAYWRREGDDWKLWAIVVNPSPAAPDVPPDSVAKRTGGAPAAGPATPADLEAADAAFSVRSASAGVGAAFREFAEPTALALAGPGHGMVWGDSAIGAYFGAAIPATDGLTWKPRIARVAPSGDLGFTIGDAVYRHTPAGGAEQRFYTKYLTVWRRQPDGSWRYAADGGNDQPAPSERGALRISRTPAGLRLVNPDSGDAFYIAFEQRTTALVNWRPCVDRARCRFVPARGERVVPLDSIPGAGASADSVTVFWWRPAAGGDGAGGFDSVRTRTVGLR